jgi:hypothetical protein
MANMQDFVDDDPGYLAWLAAHPAGFVLNTYRRPAVTISTDYDTVLEEHAS